MPKLRSNGWANEEWEEPLWHADMPLPPLQADVYPQPQTACVRRGNKGASHQAVLFGGERTRCRQAVGDEQVKCIPLDSKKTLSLWRPHSYEMLELDELYWFVERKPSTRTRENVYVLTMVSRTPRQIVGFDVAYDKSPERIQAMVDATAPSQHYCTDGYPGYLDIVYPGKHTRNIRNKSDTFTVEGINADLRHYIPILARKSRCFARKMETLQAVIEVFVQAYNAFGRAKHKYRQRCNSREVPFAIIDFL